MGGAVQEVAPVLIPIVAVVASVVGGPEIGAAIMGYGDTIEAVAAGYSVETLATVGSAATGAASNAITEAQKSGDPVKILEAAGTGAAGAVVGSEVGQAVSGATGSPTAAATASGATRGFTTAELSGKNLSQSGQSALLGGATAGATEALFGAAPGETQTEADKIAKSIGGQFIGQNLSQLLSPTKSASTAGRSAAPTSASTTAAPGTTTYQVGAGAPVTSAGGTTPGSAALGQALRTGSPDPGAPIESPTGSDKTNQNVWNLASLRVKDETGS